LRPPIDNGDGTYTGQDQLDVSGLTDAGGFPVNVYDVTVTDTNGDGTGDAILTFSNGESITLVGVLASQVNSLAALEAMGIPAAGPVDGTAGDDVMNPGYTDAQGDQIDGTDGLDDIIYGYGGNDIITAGAGNDTVYADTGDDTVYAGDGNDTVFGNEGNDTVYGGAGDDLINTRTSPGTGIPDRAYNDGTGGPLNYPADPAPSNDRDVVFGEDGNDVILTGDDNDTISGGEGNDTIDAGFDDDFVEGDAGIDLLQGNEGQDTIFGGAGDDEIYGELSPVNFDYAFYLPYELPNDGSDAAPDNNADILHGGDGNDTIYGQDDNDILYGDDGNDTLYGGLDDDTLYGGLGDDTLFGNQADDTFVLEDSFGNDVIIGGETGQTNGDTLDLSAVTSATTIDLTSADPEAGTVSDGTSTATFTEIENIILGAGVDTLVLADGSGNDTVSGFAAPIDNGDGTYTGQDQLDVSGLTDAGGFPVNVYDVTVTDTNGDGTGDAILTFSNGESITLVGVLASQVSDVAALEAMGIPGNNAPVATDNTLTVGENGGLPGVFNLLTDGTPDSDLDGDTLAVTHVNGSTGNVGSQFLLPSGASLTVQPDGSYSYNPNGQFESLGVGETATDSFTYTVSDGFGGTDTATVTITVNGANDVPFAIDNAAAVTVGGAAAAGNVVTDLVPDFDADGDVLTVAEIAGYAVSGATSFVSAYGTFVINPDGSYTYTIDETDPAVAALRAGQSLVDFVDYMISDGNGGTSHGVLSVTIDGTDAGNVVATVNTNAVTAISAVASGNVLSDDDGAGSDTAKANLTQLVWEDLFVDEQFVADGTPFAVGGVDVTISISDPTAISTSQNGTVETSIMGAHRGQLFLNLNAINLTTQTSAELSFGFSDPVDNLGFTLLDFDSSQAASPDWQDQVTITGTNGGVPVSYTVIATNGIVDATGGTYYGTGDAANADANANFYIQFDGPVDSVSIDYDYGPDVTVTNGSNQFIGISDLTWQTPETLTITEVDGAGANVGAAVAGQYGNIVINGDGSYDYTLDTADAGYIALGAGDTAIETFTYTISDGNGDTDTSTVTITVNGANDVPFAIDDAAAVTVGGAAAAGNVVTDGTPDFDVDGDALTVAEIAGYAVSGATSFVSAYGTFVINPDGSYTYTIDETDPAVAALRAGQSLVDFVDYTVSDGNGGTSHGVLSVTIDGTDAGNVVATVNTNAVTAISAVASGNVLSDDDGAGSDTAKANLTQLVWEDLFVDEQFVADGTPFAVGGVDVTISISDPTAISTSQNGTVETSIMGAHRGQLFLNLNAINLTTQTSAELSFGFSDPVDNLGFTLLDFDSSTGVPPNWQDQVTITGTNGGVPVTFTVIATNGIVDATGGTYYGTASANNADGNANLYVQFDGPVDSVVIDYAYGPDVTATNGGSQILGISDLTWQTPETLTVTAVEGAGANVGAAVAGQYGNIVINPDGSYDYTLDTSDAGYIALGAGETATDSFTYTISDGNGDTDTATVTITVNGANDAPTSVDVGGVIAYQAYLDICNLGTHANVTVGSAIADFSNIIDPDVADTHTLTIVDGTGSPVIHPDFEIDGRPAGGESLEHAGAWKRRDRSGHRARR
jgi:VCBS repeat-containing protein